LIGATAIVVKKLLKFKVSYQKAVEIL